MSKSGPGQDTHEWLRLLPAGEWQTYREVLSAAQARGLRFALGGGLTLWMHAGRFRDTKDMDLFVLPAQREAFVELLNGCGFADYYARLPYDRKWIYRALREDIIVDVIWQMANYRAPVDEQWLTRGRTLELDGLAVRLLPVEELLWSKLYILQRERCDWTDLLNVLNAQGAALDWSHLLRRVGADVQLLAGLMSVFAWLCPTQARSLPAWIWERMGLKEPAPGPDCRADRAHVRLLDSRDWFGPSAESDP